jgi:hypothetical protein
MSNYETEKNQSTSLDDSLPTGQTKQTKTRSEAEEIVLSPEELAELEKKKKKKK